MVDIIDIEIVSNCVKWNKWSVNKNRIAWKSERKNHISFVKDLTYDILKK
jgi:hypothetical protein